MSSVYQLFLIFIYHFLLHLIDDFRLLSEYALDIPQIDIAPEMFNSIFLLFNSIYLRIHVNTQ